MVYNKFLVSLQDLFNIQKGKVYKESDDSKNQKSDKYYLKTKTIL